MKWKAKAKALWKNTYRRRGLLLLALPGIIVMFLWEYVPLYGLTIAFKDFNIVDGIFGSPWCGLDNFRIFVTSKRVIWRIIRNTVGYWALFTVLGMFCNVTLALLLNECRNKFFKKVAHTIMIAPTFISIVAVVFITKAFLLPGGVINQVITAFGGTALQFYSNAKYWPVILTAVQLIKSTGYGSIIYLAAMAGIDQSLYEAADIDGATHFQRVTKITIPMILPLISIQLISSLGGIMSSNTGLFYQVPLQIGTLYSTTQTIDSYIFAALVDGNTQYGMTSAITFLQGMVGLIMVLIGNGIVRRINDDNALF